MAPEDREFEGDDWDAAKCEIAKLEAENAKLREACEIVHATANGNTYGLTVEEQLEALRLAARHCSKAIGANSIGRT
jgi:hypothetical protein